MKVFVEASCFRNNPPQVALKGIIQVTKQAAGVTRNISLVEQEHPKIKALSLFTLLRALVILNL
jgi:hypothetical protein